MAAPPTRGSKFRSDVDDRFEPLDLTQSVVVDQIVALLDELEQLEAAVAVDGITVTGGNGQIASHPALATARQHRLAIASLIAKLGIEAESAGTRSGRRAANARWGNTREQQEN